MSYRWRRTIEDEWQWGSITFVHHHDPRPNYAVPVSTRKPSAANRAGASEPTLSDLGTPDARRALFVRDYFRDGGDGAKIPETFQVTVDSYSRDLNNYSTQFWRQQP